MNEEEPPSTSSDGGDSSSRILGRNKKRRGDVAQAVLQRAMKVSEQESFVFKNSIRFQVAKGHILPSVCRHEEGIKCTVCEFENGLGLHSLPEMIFADNVLEVYAPINAERPFIKFNAYDALKLVDPNTLPNITVDASEAWKKARPSLPEVPFSFDWTYTSNYLGTVEENVRIEPTNETINLEKLMRRDPIVFYAAIPLYEDELDDNGCTEMTIKVRAMSTNYFVLCRFYLRVDRVIVRVYDCRLYSEEGWNYVLREMIKREAFYKDIGKEHHHLITDPAQIWQHLPVIEQKTEKIFYPA